MKKLFLTIIFSFLASQALAAELIPQGITNTDFDGDAIQETVVRAWRNNSNSHGFYGISFYKTGRDGLNLISVELEPMIFTKQGAGCILLDYWIIDGDHKKILVSGHRPLGNGYEDKDIVTFDFYTLKENTEKIPGIPEWFFEIEKTVHTKERYCHVHDAFDAEDPVLIK